MSKMIAEFPDVPSKTITLSMQFGERAITRAAPADPLLKSNPCPYSLSPKYSWKTISLSSWAWILGNSLLQVENWNDECTSSLLAKSVIERPGSTSSFKVENGFHSLSTSTPASFELQTHWDQWIRRGRWPNRWNPFHVPFWEPRPPIQCWPPIHFRQIATLHVARWIADSQAPIWGHKRSHWKHKKRTYTLLLWNLL